MKWEKVRLGDSQLPTACYDETTQAQYRQKIYEYVFIAYHRL